MTSIDTKLVSTIKELEQKHGIIVDDHFGIHNELKGALIDSDMASAGCSYYFAVDRQNEDNKLRTTTNSILTR